MKPLKLFGLFVILGFVGCEPAAKPVRLDLSAVDAVVESRSVVLEGQDSSIQQDLSGLLVGRAARFLEEKEGQALWDGAQATLAENRRVSLLRLRSDLERRYQGELRALSIVDEREALIRNDELWRLTLDRIRELMNTYAGRKTELSAELASMVGWPEKGQSLPRRTRNDLYYSMREKRVEELRNELRAIQEKFETEMGDLLFAYRDDVSRRAEDLEDLAILRDRAAVARAEEEASRAIREVMGQIDATIPQLVKQLIALPDIRAAAKQAETVSVPDERVSWSEGLSDDELQKYVIVFLKSRGYALSTKSEAADVTEEFKEWLERSLATR